jgi:hypothetical protein
MILYDQNLFAHFDSFPFRCASGLRLRNYLMTFVEKVIGMYYVTVNVQQTLNESNHQEEGAGEQNWTCGLAIEANHCWDRRV